MMNTFTARSLEAADRLALTRPDDGGAPCPQLARRVPAMIAATHEPVDARPPSVAPAETSGGAARRPGHLACTRR
jgi:hypothetical protein